MTKPAPVTFFPKRTQGMVPNGLLGILLINFGEPTEPTPEAVAPFLERIFLQNGGLEDQSGEAAGARARELALARTPGLVEEYREIGGSPLNAQADAQAEALDVELRSQARPTRVYSSFQFAGPSIAQRLEEARADGVTDLLALPVYPFCGQSTTVAALGAVRSALDATAWAPRVRAVSGWHHHPAYVSLRTEQIRAWAAERDLQVTDPDVLLYFSVHGTPLKYLHEGNRYDRYVDEHCRDIARRLGADRYAVGFQNHGNRRIRWTSPDNEDRIGVAAESQLVVVPISFMHEQSETLAELDHDLREFAEGVGKEFHRVPVPHDDEGFIRFLADLVGAAGAPEAPSGILSPCRCTPWSGTWCTNGNRDLPPSPFTEGTRT